MLPISRRKYFAITIKLAILVLFIMAGSFMLYKGNFIIRGVVLFLALSFLVFRIWRHKHSDKSKYNEVGYWSGLDDFELGIDLHCFDDLDLDEDEDEDEDEDFNLLLMDYFKRRHYR